MIEVRVEAVLLCGGCGAEVFTELIMQAGNRTGGCFRPHRDTSLPEGWLLADAGHPEYDDMGVVCPACQAKKEGKR